LFCGKLDAQIQPVCPNANFAQGGFNNWSGFTGDYLNPFSIIGENVFSSADTLEG
jgi:hypothetical protein